MASNFYYTHHVEFNNSSVIQDAFYNKNSTYLFVCFHNGSVAGYYGVSEDTFKEFSRASSAGQYYNYYIKNRFQTASSDVVFVPKDADSSVKSAPEKPVKTDAQGRNDAKTEYVVTVRVDGLLEFKVPADDVVSAMEYVSSILKVSSTDGKIKYTFEGVSKS
jgi:hypothetical protein